MASNFHKICDVLINARQVVGLDAAGGGAMFASQGTATIEPTDRSRVIKRKEVLDGFADLPLGSLIIAGRPDFTPQPEMRPAAPSQSYTPRELSEMIEKAKACGHVIAVINGRQAPKIGQWLTEKIQDSEIDLGEDFDLKLVCQLKGSKVADVRVDEDGVEWLCTKKNAEAKLAPELKAGEWRNVRSGQKVLQRQGELQLDKDGNVILLPKGARVGWTVDAFDAAAIYWAMRYGRLTAKDLKEPNYRDPDWRDRMDNDLAVLKVTAPQVYVDYIREETRRSMIDDANDLRTKNAAGGHASTIEAELQRLGAIALLIANKISKDSDHKHHLHAKYFLNAGKFLDKPSKEGIVTPKAKGGVKYWGDFTAAFHAAIKYDRTTRSFSLRECAFLNRRGELIELPFVTNSYAHGQLLGGNGDRVSTTPSGASRLVDCWKRTLQTFSNRDSGNELAQHAGSMNRFERNIYQFLNEVIQEAFANGACYTEEAQGELL